LTASPLTLCLLTRCLYLSAWDPDVPSRSVSRIRLRALDCAANIRLFGDLAPSTISLFCIWQSCRHRFGFTCTSQGMKVGHVLLNTGPTYSGNLYVSGRNSARVIQHPCTTERLTARVVSSLSLWLIMTDQTAHATALLPANSRSLAAPRTALARILAIWVL